MYGALLQIAVKLQFHVFKTEDPFFRRVLFICYTLISIQIDIHLHCDEWDRALEEGNWEPQQIAAKLCNFLQFVRDVQQNVSPKAIRGD